MYLPTSQRLTAMYVGRAAMPMATVQSVARLAVVALAVVSNGVETHIHYTTDGTEATVASPIYAAPFTALHGSTIRAISVSARLEDVSRELNLVLA
jgi:D-alanyl-D-alanine dipeptidase